MGTCIFKTSEIKRCVQHSLNSTNWGMECDEPSILFVHDQGVYLMSNGTPADMEGEQSAYVAFAKGCNPKKDDDWWEEARFLVGGDDFGETLPISQKTLQLCNEYNEMHIKVSEEQLEIVFAKPKKPRTNTR